MPEGLLNDGQVYVARHQSEPERVLEAVGMPPIHWKARILWPDYRICPRTKWALHVHFDIVVPIDRFIRPAQGIEISRTADACKDFFHHGFRKMLAQQEFTSGSVTV